MFLGITNNKGASTNSDQSLCYSLTQNIISKLFLLFGRKRRSRFSHDDAQIIMILLIVVRPNKKNTCVLGNPTLPFTGET